MGKNKESSSFGLNLFVIALIFAVGYLFYGTMQEKHGDFLGFIKQEINKFSSMPGAEYLKQFRARLAMPDGIRPATPETPKIILEENEKPIDKLSNKDRKELDALLNKME